MKNIWKSDLAEKISSDLYGSFGKVTSTIQKRRIALSGHVFGDDSSAAQQPITWVPARRGRAYSKRMFFYYIHKHTDERYCSGNIALWGQFPPRRLLGVDRK